MEELVAAVDLVLISTHTTLQPTTSMFRVHQSSARLSHFTHVLRVKTGILFFNQVFW